MEFHRHASIFTWHDVGEQSGIPSLFYLPETHNEP